ncbi:hypothetical protein ACOSP7_011959 [Xanthoceras sorbifolium]
MSCIISVSYKVILNGEVTPGCGLRQCDSLSPYIFVLYMEKLSHMVMKKLEEKKWIPIKVSRGGTDISYIFFADDLILFGPATSSQAKNMKDCMDGFCSISGQQKNKGGLGVKHMKDLSQSLLAKASWRLMQDDDNLWCRMIRCKHLKGRHLSDSLKDKINSYCVWKGITHGAKCVLRGLLWRVGNGRNINFWLDNWLPNVGVLPPHALDELNQVQLNRKMCHFLNEGVWKINLLCEWLPFDIVNCIVSIPAGKDSSERDKYIWGHSKSGCFYSLIHNNHEADLWKLRFIWNIKVPPKILMFLWVLLHGNTMTNAQRCIRCTSNNANCPRCVVASEDLNNLFRGCPAPTFIWKNCCKESTKSVDFNGG